MNAPQSKAKALFLDAVELLTPAQRQAYLDVECGDDVALRCEVEDLLRHFGQVGSFLESTPADPALTVDEPLIQETPGTVIGPYKLLEQIGEGGFGIVFMAEQQQPVRRKVALKVLKPGMDTHQVVARFEVERQALAIMDHPNIAKVLDGGTTPSGRPYFVMELVKGAPISDFCDQNHLTLRERLGLFVSVCRAVQHAHQKGIIHRDLKPSNVLVTLHDTTPVVKVIDFGVAKALGQELTDKTLFTGFAQMVGTPLFMSPEQAGQSGLDVDTRSDIYSLGVLLYELLTGTTPFDKEWLRTASYEEIRRIIREEEPVKPSTRINTLGEAAGTVSANRNSDPVRLSQLLRGELDWVVMKALEKDRNRRYESASAFAADVQRYLADEPVQACPPTVWYRFRKFTRRNKAVLTTATALAVAILVGIGSLIGTVTVLAENNAQIKRDQKKTKDALAREKQTSEELRQVLYRHGIALAQREWLANNVARAEQLLNECPEELREWEWHYVKRLCRAGKRPLHGTAAAPVTCVAYSPDGRRVAAGRRNGVVDVWDVATGRLQIAVGNHTEIVRDLAFSPDSQFLASAGEDGGVRVISLATGQLIHTFPTPTPFLRKITYSPDGRYLAASDTLGTVQVWDARTRKILHVLPRQRYAVMGLAFDPDSKRLAVGDLDGKVTVNELGLAGFREVLTFPTHTNLRSLAWSPRGEWLATVADDKTVRLWDAAAGLAVRTFWGHGGSVFTVAFRPDGRCLASASYDKSVKLWDPSTGQELLTLHGTGPSMPDLYPAVAFSPDGDHLVTGSEQRDAVRLWDVNFPAEGRTLPLGGSISNLTLAFSPDGTQIAAVGPPGQTVVVCHAGTGRQLFRLKGHKYWVRSIAYSPDGKLLAVAGGNWVTGRDGAIVPGHEAEIKVWQLSNQRELITFRGPPGAFTSVAFSPDGKRLAAAVREQDKPGAIFVWDSTSGVELQTWREPDAMIGCVAFSPSLPRLASEVSGGVVKLLDMNTGLAVGMLRGHTAPITCLSISRDGQLLATAADRTIKIWDFTTGNELRALRGLPSTVHGMAFSPNGKRLATTADQGVVSLWDVTTGHEVLTLQGGGWPVAFSPDGSRLTSTSREGIRIWQIAD
jgi:WD40 repeat protein/serine/threonine protein kinase